MKFTEIVCEYCGKALSRPTKEVTRSRKLGRRQFCNESCGAKFSNEPRKAPTTTKPCKFCGVPFETKEWGKRRNDFCSRVCASAGSVTDTRREAARLSGFKTQFNLLTTAESLKRREAWKYVELEAALKGVPHEFEFALGGYVFDLALLGLSTLVEFDGKYHTGKQLTVDSAKDALAVSQGLSVVRIKTDDTKVIPSAVLNELFENARNSG